METNLQLPADALLVLVGPAGCGKSTFAAARFAPSEIVSSDAMRLAVTDDVTSQYANADVFALVHQLTAARLKHRRFTVIDATNLKAEDRAQFRRIATTARVPVIALVLPGALEDCLRQNRLRIRKVPDHIIVNHCERYQATLLALPDEGFTAIYTVDDTVNVTVGQLPVHFAAGWDIVGDVHGCVDELADLIASLGYGIMTQDGKAGLRHPQGRRLAFVGDFTDRGPDSYGVLNVVQWLTKDGHVAVRGNHDNKLLRALNGNKVKVAHGLQGTLEQLAAQASLEYILELRAWLEALPYYVRLATLVETAEVVLSHAGLPFDAVGRSSKVIDAHCLYGEVDGKTEEGFPRRSEKWRAPWDGSQRTAVFGHTPQMDGPSIWSNSVNIDTGCVFGGALSAFRWPERDVCSIPARREYAQRNPSVLPAEDV